MHTYSICRSDVDLASEVLQMALPEGPARPKMAPPEAFSKLIEGLARVADSAIDERPKTGERVWGHVAVGALSDIIKQLRKDPSFLPVD